MEAGRCPHKDFAGPGVFRLWAAYADGGVGWYDFDPAAGVVRVYWFAAPKEAAGSGWGSKKFLALARAWKAAGYAEVLISLASASAKKGFTGYYFWPRLGFTGDIPQAARARLGLTETRIEDLFATEHGRARWRESGSTLRNLRKPL